MTNEELLIRATFVVILLVFASSCFVAAHVINVRKMGINSDGVSLLFFLTGLAMIVVALPLMGI